MLTLRTQRRSQPQQPVAVDFPYAKASLCVNYAVGGKNLIDGTRPSSRVGNGTRSPSLVGVCKTGYDGGSNTAADVYGIPSTSVFTLICAYDLSGSSGSYSPIIGGDQTGNRQFQLRVTPSNTIEFIRFNTSVSTFTATTATTGRTGCVVAISDGASVRLVHKGVVTSTATITGTPKPLTVVAPGGYLGFDQQPAVNDKGVSMCAVLPFALSNAEAVALSLNPWQIFSPTQRIWVPVAAGGATYTLTSDSGSFALTGQAAALKFNRVLASDSGAIALTGQNAALLQNRVIASDSGAFALTGQDSALKFNRSLSVSSGSFALSGSAATLTYTPISGATYTLAADSGSFALSGAAAALKFNRVLSAASGSYVLSGYAVTMVPPNPFTAGELAYLLSYMQANLTGLLKRWNGSAWV